MHALVSQTSVTAQMQNERDKQEKSSKSMIEEEHKMKQQAMEEKVASLEKELLNVKSLLVQEKELMWHTRESCDNTLDVRL